MNYGVRNKTALTLMATLLLYSGVLAQFGVSVGGSSYLNIENNKYIAYRYGFSPQIQLSYQYAKHFETSVRFEHVWWSAENTKIKTLRSFMAGIEEQYGIPIGEHSLKIGLGVLYAYNTVRFDPNGDIVYHSDFKWQNFGYQTNIQFLSKMGAYARIGYLRLLPSLELPVYKSGFIQIAVGYRLQL